jgi:DNA invertase Pin-like site-specific DNA recombinase
MISRYGTDSACTGTNVDHPQLQMMLKEMSEDDPIIVAYLSRLSRNKDDALDPAINLSTKEWQQFVKFSMMMCQLESESLSRRVNGYFI